MLSPAIAAMKNYLFLLLLLSVFQYTSSAIIVDDELIIREESHSSEGYEITRTGSLIIDSVFSQVGDINIQGAGGSFLYTTTFGLDFQLKLYDLVNYGLVHIDTASFTGDHGSIELCGITNHATMIMDILSTNTRIQFKSFENDGTFFLSGNGRSIIVFLRQTVLPNNGLLCVRNTILLILRLVLQTNKREEDLDLVEGCVNLLENSRLELVGTNAYSIVCLSENSVLHIFQPVPAKTPIMIANFGTTNRILLYYSGFPVPNYDTPGVFSFVDEMGNFYGVDVGSSYTVQDWGYVYDITGTLDSESPHECPCICDEDPRSTIPETSTEPEPTIESIESTESTDPKPESSTEPETSIASEISTTDETLEPSSKSKSSIEPETSALPSTETETSLLPWSSLETSSNPETVPPPESSSTSSFKPLTVPSTIKVTSTTACITTNYTQTTMVCTTVITTETACKTVATVKCGTTFCTTETTTDIPTLVTKTITFTTDIPITTYTVETASVTVPKTDSVSSGTGTERPDIPTMASIPVGLARRNYENSLISGFTILVYWVVFV